MTLVVPETIEEIEKATQLHARFRARVVSELESMAWVSTTPREMDFMNDYVSRAERRGLGSPMSIMPPSPGSKSVSYTGFFEKSGEGYKMNWGTSFEMRPQTLELLKELPLDQIMHRGRVGTIGSSLLQGNEWRRRQAKTIEATEQVPDAALSDGESSRLATGVAEITLKHLVFSPAKIDAYRTSHSNSSAVPGIKWGQTPAGTDEIWRELYDWIVKFHEDWRDGKLFGKLMNRTLWSGMRARNKSSLRTQTPGMFPSFIEEDDRSRIVNFWIGLSSVGAFIDDKAAWYNELLLFGNTITKPPLGGGRSISPLVEGGLVYTQVADQLASGESEPLIVELGDDRNIIFNGKINAYDMNACEAITGWTLGKAFWPLMTSAGGFAQLGSGIIYTSIFDMYTTQQFASKLGYLKGNDATLEFQEADTEVQFLLGMRYKEDPLRPRFQGVKLTGDSAEKAMNLSPYKNIKMNGSHDLDVIQRWCDAYRGQTPDGDSLLESIRKTANELDYFDPSKFVTQAVI